MPRLLRPCRRRRWSRGDHPDPTLTNSLGVSVDAISRHRLCDACCSHGARCAVQAAGARPRRSVRRHARAEQCHHRRGQRDGGPHHAHFGQRGAGGGEGPGAHRRHGGAAAGEGREAPGVRRLVLAQRQRRDDGHHLGPGIRVPGRSGHHHQYEQRGRGAGRGRRVAAQGQSRGGLVAAGGGRDVRRHAQRHQWLSREAGRCVECHRDGERRAGGGRERRWRHGDDLQRLQGRDRHVVARRAEGGGGLHRGRAGAVQLRRGAGLRIAGAPVGKDVPTLPMCMAGSLKPSSPVPPRDQAVRHDIIDGGASQGRRRDRSSS